MQRSQVEARVIGSLAGLGLFAGDRPAQAEEKVQVGWARRAALNWAWRSQVKVVGLGRNWAYAFWAEVTGLREPSCTGLT